MTHQKTSQGDDLEFLHEASETTSFSNSVQHFMHIATYC